MWCYLLRKLYTVAPTCRGNITNKFTKQRKQFKTHRKRFTTQRKQFTTQHTQFISQRTQLFISQRTQFITQPTILLKLHQNYELLLELHQYGI